MSAEYSPSMKNLMLLLFNGYIKLDAHHPQLCLKFTTGDFLVGTGDINKHFILDFYGS